MTLSASLKTIQVEWYHSSIFVDTCRLHLVPRPQEIECFEGARTRFYPYFIKFLPKFDPICQKKLLGDAAVYPAPTVLSHAFAK